MKIDGDQLLPWINPWPHPLSDFCSGSLASNPSRASTSEVAIVGAGIVGLSLAYHLLLADNSLQVAVLEADEPGSGSTGKSFGVLVPTLMESTKRSLASLGHSRTREAYRELRDVRDELISLGLAQPTSVFVYSAALTHATRSLGAPFMSAGIKALEAIGVEVQLVRRPRGRGDGLLLGGFGVCNPLELVSFLVTQIESRGGVVLAGTRVESLETSPRDGVSLQTTRGVHSADVGVVATSGTAFEGRSVPWTRERLSHGLRLEFDDGVPVDHELSQVSVDAGSGGFFARRVGHECLLFGSSETLRGRSTEDALTLARDRDLTEARRRFPDSVATGEWAGPVYYSSDQLPSISVENGRRIDLVSCNGRGLLIGFALGRHVAQSILSEVEGRTPVPSPTFPAIGELQWSRR